MKAAMLRMVGVSMMALAATTAHAQTTAAAPDPQAAASADAATQADRPTTPTTDTADIIVTAQRRSERLQDVPISIAVVGGDTLQNRSLQNFEQLAPLVPNLTIAKSPSADLIVLRGIGSSPGSPSQDQSVVMFIDGIYAGNARQFATPFLDIERLEILRGPQGALVGRNTSAGAINIITRKPGTTFGGYVNADYNFEYDGPAIEGGLDLPISNAVRLRAVGKYTDVGGFVRNIVSNRDEPSRKEWVGRVTALVDNGGPVVATAKYEHADTRRRGSGVQILAANKGEVLDYRSATGGPLTGPQYDNVRTDNVSLQFDLDLGGLTLASISGYSTFKSRQLLDADFFSTESAKSNFDQDFNQLSQELRLLSPSGGRIGYTLGAYYSAADLEEQRTTGLLFAPPASTYRRFRQQDEVISIFGQLTLNVTTGLRLNGSGRYTLEDKDAIYRRFGGPLAQTDRTGTLAASFDGRTRDRRFDPAASIQFDIDRNAMLYASFSKGSKSSGFQGAISNATAFSFAYLPERSTAYEIGAKLTFPGVGYLNIAAFDTKYTNLQVSTLIATPGSLATNTFTGNAPRAYVRGAEVELALRPAKALSVDGSLAWLPTARYGTFTTGPCIILQPSNGTLPGSCDQSGQRLGFTPRYSGSLSFTLSAPLGGDLVGKATASPNFQSSSYRDFVNDPVTRQDSFAKLDARIAVATRDDRYEIALIGTNLTNRRTIAFGTVGGLANTFVDPAARIAFIEPPRTAAIHARMRF